MHKPRHSAAAAMALVLLMHVALVVLLLHETPALRRNGVAAPSRPSILWLREVPATATASAPLHAAGQPARPSPPRVPRPRPMPKAPEAPAVAVTAITVPVVPAASAASTPVPLLLDTDATRRAIRQAARVPSLRERTAAASEERAELTPEQRLGRDIEHAAVGDCLKGEFAGAGMGLLSLPFWLAAEARGKCRR